MFQSLFPVPCEMSAAVDWEDHKTWLSSVCFSLSVFSLPPYLVSRCVFDPFLYNPAFPFLPFCGMWGWGGISCNVSTQGQHICCLTSLLRDIKEKNCFLIVGSICNRPHSSSHVSPQSQQGRLSPLWNPTHQSRWSLIWITACFESNSKQG